MAHYLLHFLIHFNSFTFFLWHDEIFFCNAGFALPSWGTPTFSDSSILPTKTFCSTENMQSKNYFFFRKYYLCRAYF